MIKFIDYVIDSYRYWVFKRKINKYLSLIEEGTEKSNQQAIDLFVKLALDYGLTELEVREILSVD